MHCLIFRTPINKRINQKNKKFLSLFNEFFIELQGRLEE